LEEESDARADENLPDGCRTFFVSLLFSMPLATCVFKVGPLQWCLAWMLHKNLSAVMWFLFMPGCIAVCIYIVWTCAHGAVGLLVDNDDEDDSNDDESIYVGIRGRAAWALPGRQRRGGGIKVDQLSLDLQYPVYPHNYAPDYQLIALQVKVVDFSSRLPSLFQPQHSQALHAMRQASVRGRKPTRLLR
jgi:hypothetical protein